MMVAVGSVWVVRLEISVFGRGSVSLMISGAEPLRATVEALPQPVVVQPAPKARQGSGLQVRHPRR